MRGASRIVALTLGVVLLAAAASAQPRDVAKADALFKEGRAALKKGDYDTACPKLEESYRLDPAAGTGINLGDCFEKQGKVASALLAYEAARALLKPGDPRIGPVEKEISALDKRAPRLTIRLAPGAPEGTKVKRDGREVEAEKLGSPLVVNPGKYKIVVSAPGRDTAVFRVSLVEGERRELDVGPGGSSGEPQAARAGRARPSITEDASTDDSARTTGYWLAGIGAVALGTGVVTGLMAAQKEKTADGRCGADKTACDSEGYRAVEAGRTLNAVSYIGWGAGILGLASAGYFLFIAGPSEGTSTAVGAAATPKSGAVVLKGRF